MSRCWHVVFNLTVGFSVVSTSQVGISQCRDAPIQESQRQTLIAAPEYSKQIQLARQAALEIYDHGFLGNSGSAINNKVGSTAGNVYCSGSRWQACLGGGIWPRRPGTVRSGDPEDEVSSWQHFKAFDFCRSDAPVRSETSGSRCSNTTLCTRFPS